MTRIFPFYRFALIAALVLMVSSNASAQMNKTVALVKGNVVDQTGAPVANVAIQVYKGSAKVNTTKSTSEGTFQIILPPASEYKLICSNATYYYHEQILSIPPLEKYQEIPVTVPMRALNIGSPYPFSNMVFEPMSSTISPIVTSDLDAMAEQIKRNNKLSLAVTVYPDATGTGKSADDAVELANARKNAVAGYFMGKGLSASNVSVSISNVLGPARFERMVTKYEVETKSKHKSKSSKKHKTKVSAPVKMMVPQTADVVIRSGF